MASGAASDRYARLNERREPTRETKETPRYIYVRVHAKKRKRSARGKRDGAGAEVVARGAADQAGEDDDVDGLMSYALRLRSTRRARSLASFAPYLAHEPPPRRAATRARTGELKLCAPCARLASVCVCACGAHFLILRLALRSLASVVSMHLRARV